MRGSQCRRLDETGRVGVPGSACSVITCLFSHQVGGGTWSTMDCYHKIHLYIVALMITFFYHLLYNVVTLQIVMFQLQYC